MPTPRRFASDDAATSVRPAIAEMENATLCFINVDPFFMLDHFPHTKITVGCPPHGKDHPLLFPRPQRLCATPDFSNSNAPVCLLWHDTQTYKRFHRPTRARSKTVRE